MEENNKKEDKKEKMSYEQLEGIAHQLSEQNRQLYTQLLSLNMSNMFKRLDYLFKVIENNHMFKEKFVESCINEIEEIITVPEEESKTE